MTLTPQQLIEALGRGELLCPECGEPTLRHLERTVACLLTPHQSALAAARVLADEVGRKGATLWLLQTGCPLCLHEWSRHDPEDGRCDAGPPCKCGRDLEWMQGQIRAHSRAALTACAEGSRDE